jgi:GNAT superfamily N-acetyltransferase
MLGRMATWKTASGVEYDRRTLDRTEQRFWREIWESVPPAVATEHGIKIETFGPVQATLVAGLAELGMMNLALGATEPGAVAGGHLGTAADWIRARRVAGYVPVTPDLPETEAAESWLAMNAFAPAYGWMKFVRDAHPPRFKTAGDVEIVAVTDPDAAPFGTIAAVGFGLPAWAADFFAGLPGRRDWRCYVARVDGEPQACATMLIDGEVAELGIGATLEPARGRGCQLALLGRRIEDAAAAGCRLLYVETGERVLDRPASSYRNILRAGFEEAYVCPNWSRPRPGA